MSVTYWQVQAPVGTPLAKISQWAGTSGGAPGQPAPLGAVRNGTGRYWFGADYNTPLAQPGTKRPMAPFSTSAACFQGGQARLVFSQSNNETDVNIQGSQFYSGPSPATICQIGANQRGLNVRLDGSSYITGLGGAGGGWVIGPQWAIGNPGAPGNPAVILPGPNPVVFYNYGTINGGGGGGASGNYGYISGGGGGGGGGGALYATVNGGACGAFADNPALSQPTGYAGGYYGFTAGSRGQNSTGLNGGTYGPGSLIYHAPQPPADPYGQSNYPLDYGGAGGSGGNVGQSGQGGIYRGYQVYWNGPTSSYINQYGPNGPTGPVGSGGAAGQGIQGIYTMNNFGSFNP